MGHYWTPSGNINYKEVGVSFEDSHLDRYEIAEILKELLFEVWADAYTHGWSDGRADRDPNKRENPYK